MEVIRLIRVELIESLRQLAKREQGRALDVRDLMFVWLPNVDDLNPEIRVFQSLFHLLDCDFV